MNYSIVDCVDAGSEHCPCYLALTGDCLTCSRLQGKDYCDCNWKGVCVYSEFQQNQQRPNSQRKDFQAAIVDRKEYLPDLMVLVLEVGKGFAIRASRPGSYVFLRPKEQTAYYQAPISVLHADVQRGQIHLAIKIISSKTRLLIAEQMELMVRGPYQNGIQGIREPGIRPGIDATSLTRRDQKEGPILMITRGIGIAPGILAASGLRGNRRVDLMVDPEKITTELVEDYRVPSCTLQYISLVEEETLHRIREQCREVFYQRVFLLMSDYHLKQVGALIREVLPNAKLCLSNNFRLCCGEGICGSCSATTNQGENIKMCKCQMNAGDLFDQELI